MRYELMVGLRYTRAKRRNRFISFISLISMVMYMALGRTRFPPSFLGKLTTTAQILTVSVILLGNWLARPLEITAPALVWASLALTLASGFHYIYLATRLANAEGTW